LPSSKIYETHPKNQDSFPGAIIMIVHFSIVWFVVTSKFKFYYLSYINFAGQFFRSLWGSHAGWAQAVLFAYDIKPLPKLYIME